MKNLWTLIVLAGLVLVVSVAPVVAQAGFTGTNVDVKFTAPMAFYAGDKLLPAGSYEITQGAGAQANMLLVKGKGKNETYVEFTPIASQAPLEKMEVTFNKYGNTEYLNSVKWPGGAESQGSWIMKLNPSAGEQAAAKAAAAAAHSVPASGKK